MKKQNIVISGSARLVSKMDHWTGYWTEKGYTVIDHPKILPPFDIEAYKGAYENFYKNINESDAIFIANENRENIKGYIGPETFAELSYAIVQKLVGEKKIKIILYQIPGEEVACFNEVKLFIELKLIDEILNV